MIWLRLFFPIALILTNQSMANTDQKLRLSPPSGSALQALQGIDMPELGDGRLDRILGRYYKEALGGPKNWERISSLRISGTIRFESGEFKLTALQRKPNQVKMTLRQNQQKLILASDGETAWQHAPRSGEAPQIMPEKEGRRFKMSAHFGSLLLNPFAEGKEITFIDTVPTEGHICHQVRVVLEEGFQLDYFIDIRTFLEVKIEMVDLREEGIQRTVFADYKRVSGFPVAQRIDNYRDDEWLSTLLVDEVRVNTGIVPWMFDLPR